MDQNFKDLLDSEYNWPDYYLFKFIIKNDQKDVLLKTLEIKKYDEHLSKKGTYISITYRKLIHASEEVLEIYKKAKTIPGVMTL